MAELHIACLGDFQVTLAGTALTGFSTEKSRALLLYLALETQVHQRTELAQFLWPGYSAESARNSLRQTLHQLRQVLRDGETATWLLLTRQTVQINPAANIRVDVTTFSQLLATCATHAHVAVTSCAACLERLQQAVDLYRGDFLSGFTVDDSAPFEEWRRIIQEQLHIQMLDALQQLATVAESRGDSDGALRFAYRQLALEPWLEAAHRQVMRLQLQLGQRTAALAQYQRCRQVLAAELGVEPDAETIALYEQIRSGQPLAPRTAPPVIPPVAPPLAAPPATPAPPPVEQPAVLGKVATWAAQLPPLLGRPAELAQLTNLLAQPSCRLVTLVGPPGVGKTRLAQAVLEASPWQQSGYFIELAALRDPTLLATTIAHALTTAHPTLQVTGERLIEGLRDQELLLVLDNFEQVLPGVALVGELLAQCPGLKLLITSRASLRLSSEQVITVYPLPLPELTQPLTVASVAQNGAVQLFCQRAAAVAPNFVLTDRLAPVVVEICRRLDGLPLAIELAAAHSRLLAPPALLGRLSQRLLLLNSRSQERPERQQTLRAALAWSYELLNAEEQRLFRQLAVFVGGATLSAVEAVVGNSQGAPVAPFAAHALLAGVEALVDKNLLRQVEVPYPWGEGEPRVLMLETLREYGWELLAAAEANDAGAPQRHAEYFLTLAESAALKLHGPDQVEWLDRLTLDHDNLRAALTWFDQAGEAHKALRLATALRYFWRVRGHYREGSERLLQLLAQPEAAPTGGPGDAVRARALNAAGYLLWVQGDTATAQQLLQEALNLGRAVADAAATAFALRYLGLAAGTRQEQATARQFLEESLAIYRTLDTPNETASALMYLGDAAFGQQAYEEAQRLYQESADLLRQLGNNVVLPYALRHLGYLALARGNLKAALNLATESLRLNLATGEQQGCAAALTALAAVAVAGERWEQGARLLDCVAAWLVASRAQLLPLDRTYYEQTQRLLQQQLQDNTPSAFPAEHLSLEQAITYVQQELAFAELPEGAALPGDNKPGQAHKESAVAGSPFSLPLSLPASPAAVPPHKLPHFATPLIGREPALAELSALWRRPDLRVLTLVGPGGMGKTRLAIEVGRKQLAAFADGVWFVPLAALSSPAAIAPAIATALGMTMPSGEPGVALGQLLQQKRLLLILDNFEHLLAGSTEGVTLVSKLLEHAPAVQLLVTSRERLHLRGEQVYSVPPLPFSTDITLAEAGNSAAVRVFVQYAQLNQADFQLSATNLAAVLHICQLVQGMPLGLELAAAHVATLPLNEIANEIAASTEFLQVNWHDLPERQRSMRAVFAWSWRLLNAAEQRVLRQLSIFRGGFTRAAAQAITGVTLPVLTRLVHCSLLRRDEQTSGERYALHELLRQFAAEELAQVAPEAEQVTARYNEFYLNYLAAREGRLERAEPRAAAAEIQIELANIRHAWQSAAQRWDYATLQRSARSLFAFYRHTGLSTEAFQTFQALADEYSLRTQPDLASGQQQLPDLSPSIFVAICANLLVPQSKLEQAVAVAQQALALAQAEGVDDAAALSHLSLGQALRLQGRLADAQHHLEQTLQLARSVSVSNGKSELLHEVECVAEIWLGWLSVDAGFYQQAREPMQRSLRLAQTLGKRRMEMMALLNLANLDRLEGAYPAAQQGYEEGLRLSREVGYRWGEGVSQYELGYTLRIQGEYSRAAVLLANALTIFQEIGEHHSRANTLIALGQLSAYLGDFVAAEGWLTRYQQFIEQVQGGEATIHYLQARTVLALHQEDLTQALAYAREGWQLGQAGNPLDGQAYALIGMGHAQSQLGQLAEAATAYQQALDLYTTIQRPDLTAEAQAGLAALAQQQGDSLRALGLVETVLTQLAAQPISGQDEPFFLYLTCYQLLAAAQDPRAATILQQGYRLLQRYADQITEDRLRHSFLAKVPVHRALQQAYAVTSATVSPPHLGAPSPLYNLPAPLPPLIGRERELAEIVSRLQQPGARLLTLAGPGGMGKTRLALAAAAQVAPHFAAGVCLVPLAELTEPTLLPQTVAAALGQAEPAETGGEDPVTRYVADKSLLLVLDNCEHMAEAVAHWSKRWLSACPRLCILATSHGALTVPGEAVWPIPTLAYPPSAELEAEQLLTFAAVQLFVRRAREVKADFALTAANGGAIAEICRRLDGIPLALELAAARVRSLTPTEIAARLNKGIATALANNRSAPARHQTMQAALDWSFASLDAEEQLLFQQLAVFAGGFTLPAVESVTQLPDALDLLERLLGRALVIAETVGEQSRYRLLGVIRRYAEDKLSASGLAFGLRQRHAAHFLQLAESAQMAVQADGEALWLQPEAENLSSAVDWALTKSESGLAVRLAGALTWYWWIRGFLRNQRPVLQQALASLALANQPQASAARHHETVEAALLALAAGALFALWEEPDKARLAFTQALALAEATQHQHLIGLALRRLAAVAIGQKAYEAANEFIERGLVVWQALGGIWHVAWLYALQGDLAEQRGDHDQAWLAYEASTRLPVDPGARAYPFRRMAYLALARGERSQALALCRESLQLNLASGDRQGIAACLVGVARFTVADIQTLPEAARLPLLQRAAELLGTVEALLQTVEGRLLQVDDVAYQQTAHVLQEQLAAVAPTAYGAALAAGRALTVQQATALALQEDEITPPAEPHRQQETAEAPGDKAFGELSRAVTSDSVTELVEVSQSASHLVVLPGQALSPRHNLPATLTPFVGRTRSLAEIRSRLQQGVRLLTLIGPGGMGKTRLALAAGREQVADYPDGVWFVPLAALTNPAALAPAIATALNLSISGGDLGAALAQLLQPKRLLLILDNFEQLLAESSAGAELVAALLQAAPGVQILVTSRERLQLRSEQLYQVPPLTVDRNATLDEAATASAARLFVQSAQFVQPAFQLTDANLAAVLRICQLVQGMPLGLELAAAQVGAMALDAIADAIAQRAEFLAVDWVDLPERQRSMRAVFAWSWQLLSAAEQRALRQLSIFRGGFTHAAAQAITGVTLPTLTRLVHCSLLSWEDQGAGGRYAIHELLRQFATEELARITTEQAEVAARHSEFYLNYLAAREVRLTRAEPRAAAAEIQAELDNIRQAWQSTVQRLEFSALQRSAWALFSFYRHTGSSSEALQTFQALAEPILRPAQPGLALGQRPPPDPPQSRLVAIYAYLLTLQSKLDQAIVVAQQALARAQAEEATDAAALSHLSWGQALRLQGRLAEAQPHLEQTLQLGRLVTDPAVKSDLLYDVECLAGNALGALASDWGLYQLAREHFGRSLHLAQSLGKRRLEINSLLNLANLARMAGEYPAARQGYEDALRLTRAIGYRWGEGISQYDLGQVLRRQGEYSHAAALLENVLFIFQEIGEHFRKGNVLIALSQLYAYLGDVTAAEGWLTRYQQFIDQTQVREATIHYLQACTALAFHREDLVQALAYATESWQLGQTQSLPDIQAYGLIGIGHAQRQLGQVAAATTAYQQALDLYMTLQRPDLAAEAQAGLAALAQQQGDQPQALGLVATVLAQLAAQPLSGQDEPFFLYLTCYQVLAKAQDPRAPTILRQGYTLLQRYAEQIDADRLRQSFLENVPLHRALQQAYHDQVTSDQETRRSGDKERQDASVAVSPLRPVSPSPGRPVSLPPVYDWAEMPVVDFFVERQAEIAQLTGWLTPSTAGGVPARLISILGIGGMGKTTLAAVVTKAVAPAFAVVIWRSLLNAPPLNELLRGWLQTLSRQTLTTLPDTLDEQIRLLLSYLQQARCLLVLDNVESIFAADAPSGSAQSRAGVVRPGYAGYDQLLQRVASSDHQSCLLLTSREQPYALLRLAGGARGQAQSTARLQVLPLAGLNQQAGAALLASNGVHASAAETAQLVENYSGNPLALQIVAATIADFFGGDIALFQQEEGALFDGMRLVLDQQFARLSEMEREILIWLAIEREPITVPQLRSNLVQPVATASLIEALQALQNRSLLEKSGDGLTLQNVITEYTTEYLVAQVCQEIMASTELGIRNAEDSELRISNFALNRFALFKAQAKRYIRQSQARLILQPVADRLVATLGRAQLLACIPQLLDALRAAGVQKGYAGGNLLNLLVQLGVELNRYDFSHLPVWQADLSGLTFVTANFTGADLGRSTFTAGITVDRVAFQPTGELWIAGLQDGVLGLWRTVTGQLTDAFQRTGNLRGPLAFSPDGRFLATDSEDGHIHIWSTTTGECLQRLEQHQSTLYALAFSEDGTRLASCSSGRLVRLWDLCTGRCYQRLTGYDQGADALAFSPDGQLLATGGGDGMIQLWDAHSTDETGRRIAAWPAHRHPLGALAFSPDGRWLVSGSHTGEIQFWELAAIGAEQSQTSAGAEVATHSYRAGPICQGHTSIIRVFRFVPTSDPGTYLLASAGADRTVRIWSLTGQLRYTLLGHTNAIYSLTISPDGQQLASAGTDKQIIFWDVATGQALQSQQAYRSVLQCLAYSPDGRMLACGGADHIVRLWAMTEETHLPLNAVQTTELPAGQTPGEVSQVHHLLRGHTHFLCSVVFSPDGQTIASSDADRTIRLWDRTTGEAMQTLQEHQGSVRALAFAPAPSRLPLGELLLASAGADRIIRLWAVATQQSRPIRGRRQLVGHEDEILSLAFDPSGRYLVSGCADGSLRIWDVQRGVTVHQLTGHTAPVTAIAIHPHDNIIASSCFDQTLRLWDLTTGACLQVNRGAHMGTSTLAFSPNGQYLAYTSNDFAIYLWPWRTAAVTPISPTTPLRGHMNRVYALSFSPTAAVLASCSTDGTIRLWDVANERCSQLLRPPGPYAGMKISGVTGISEAQKAALRALGAVEE